MEFLQKVLMYGPPLLFAMVAHEYAHGYAAKRQGDLTAYQLGRLTFNPLKHIDPFMTVLLPLFLIFVNSPAVFGAAKPVPVNPRNYRNYKSGDIIVSLAGIVTNLAIAVLSVPLIMLVGWMGDMAPALARPLGILQFMLNFGVLLNLVLALFNLLPIPPLDGSHVFKYLLPLRWAVAYQNAGRYGFFILFALISFAPDLLNIWMYPAYRLYSFAQSLYFSSMLPNPFSA